MLSERIYVKLKGLTLSEEINMLSDGVNMLSEGINMPSEGITVC